MAISLSQFRTRFPEFVDVDDSVINFAIADAADDMDVVRWGNRYDTGQLFLAAHFTVLSSTNGSIKDGSVGPVQQATTGPLSVQYGSPVAKTQTDAMLTATVYGQRYLRLRNMVGMGGAIA